MHLFTLKKRAVGINIAENSVVAVSLTQCGQELILEDFFCQPMDQIDQVLQVMQLCTKEMKLNRSLCYLNMPYGSTLQQTLINKEEDFEKNFNQQSPIYIFDYEEILDAAKQKKNRVIVADKKTYELRLNWMHQLKIKLINIEPDITALIRYFFFKNDDCHSPGVFVLNHNNHARFSIFDREEVYYEDELVSQNIEMHIKNLIARFNFQTSCKLSQQNIISIDDMKKKLSLFKTKKHLNTQYPLNLFVAIGLALRGVVDEN